MQERPVLALTMGDPAGIGPEITVKSLMDKEVYAFSRPFVIGDTDIIKDALRFSELEANVHVISKPEEAIFEHGTIDVFNCDLLEMKELKYGEELAACGRAAFGYIKKSIELAMNEEVDGIVTAPINKKSLKAAGVPFIGHTEMFAELTGAKEEMTMFSILNLKIFFLTRHVSLVEACRQITVDRVLRGIEKKCERIEAAWLRESKASCCRAQSARWRKWPIW